MSFNNGDVVRIGSGKVHYTVTNTHPEKMGDVMVESHNTSKTQLVATERLTLVSAAPGPTPVADATNDEFMLSIDGSCELTDAQIESLDETYAESGMAAAQAEKREMLFELATVESMSIPNPDERDEETFGIREQPMAAWEIELVHEIDPRRPFLLTVDHVTTGYKSYGAACDALILAQREGFKHYAVIDHNGQRKAERKAA